MHNAKQVAAYLLVVGVASFGAIRGQNAQNEADEAQKVARQVDLDGDRSLCKSENKIRAKTNERDAALEATAKLVKEALTVLASDNVGDDKRLREIALKAQKIRTDFPAEKLSKCTERFPKQ